MGSRFWKWLQDSGSATAVEYGLIGVLLAVVVISALDAKGIDLKTAFHLITAVF